MPIRRLTWRHYWPLGPENVSAAGMCTSNKASLGNWTRMFDPHTRGSGVFLHQTLWRSSPSFSLRNGQRNTWSRRSPDRTISQKSRLLWNVFQQSHYQTTENWQTVFSNAHLAEDTTHGGHWPQPTRGPFGSRKVDRFSVSRLYCSDVW